MALPVIDASVAIDTRDRIDAEAGCPYRTGVWQKSGAPIPTELCAVTRHIVDVDRDERGDVTGLRLDGNAVKIAKRSQDDTLRQRVEEAELALVEEPIKVVYGRIVEQKRGGWY